MRDGIAFADKIVKLATVALLITLLTSGAALAENYSADFGAETPAGKDAGTLDCRLDQVCYAKMPSLGLTISLDVSRSDPTEAKISFYGGDLSCCYFANDRHTIRIYLRQPLSPLPFFKGARANLFIENNRAGTLYLRFHFRQDGNDKSKGRPPIWQLSNENLYRRQIPAIVHPENPDSKDL